MVMQEPLKKRRKKTLDRKGRTEKEKTSEDACGGVSARQKILEILDKKKKKAGLADIHKDTEEESSETERPTPAIQTTVTRYTDI